MLTHTLGPGVTVRTEAEPGTPALFADKAQLETVLVNLAVNARDAMPEGGTLTITASRDVIARAGSGGSEGGDYIKLTVSDTGEGMFVATLARAGEPFFTTKPPGQGRQ
jgi:signal transduction histidine kinase